MVNEQNVKSRSVRAKYRGRFLLMVILILSGFIAGTVVGLLIDFPAGGPLVPAISDRISDPPLTANLHPDYDMDQEELSVAVETSIDKLRSDFGLPPADAIEIERRISLRAQVFLEHLKLLEREEDPMLAVLADKRHALASDYEPGNLVSLNDYSNHFILNRGDLSLRSVVIPELHAMIEAAKQDGIRLDISSSYRSYAYQNGLFQQNLDELGLEIAQRVSARPGASQHQLGTTLDFGSVTSEFSRHPSGKWLAEHAGTYGFSLSYPDGYEDITGYMYEPWHYRYLGRNLLELQKEFFLGIQQYMLLFLHYFPLPASVNR